MVIQYNIIGNEMYIRKVDSKDDVHTNYVECSDDTTTDTLKTLAWQDYYRKQREIICFPIINRGEFWYCLLNSDQKAELLVWYKNWLNITETLKVPKMPSWLK